MSDADFYRLPALDQTRHALDCPVPTSAPALREARLAALLFGGKALQKLSKEERESFYSAYHPERLEFVGDRLWYNIIAETIFILSPVEPLVPPLKPSLKSIQSSVVRLATNEIGARLSTEVGLSKEHLRDRDSVKRAADAFETYIAALLYSNGRRALLEFLVPLIKREFFRLPQHQYDVLPALQLEDNTPESASSAASVTSPSSTSPEPPVPPSKAQIWRFPNLEQANASFLRALGTAGLVSASDFTINVALPNLTGVTRKGRTLGSGKTMHLAWRSIIGQVVKEETVIAIDSSLKTPKTTSLPLSYPSYDIERAAIDLERLLASKTVTNKNASKLVWTIKLKLPDRQAITVSGNLHSYRLASDKLVQRCIERGIIETGPSAVSNDPPALESADPPAQDDLPVRALPSETIVAAVPADSIVLNLVKVERPDAGAATPEAAPSTATSTAKRLRQAPDFSPSQTAMRRAAVRPEPLVFESRAIAADRLLEELSERDIPFLSKALLKDRHTVLVLNGHSAFWASSSEGFRGIADVAVAAGAARLKDPVEQASFAIAQNLHPLLIFESPEVAARDLLQVLEDRGVLFRASWRGQNHLYLPNLGVKGVKGDVGLDSIVLLDFIGFRVDTKFRSFRKREAIGAGGAFIFVHRWLRSNSAVPQRTSHIPSFRLSLNASFPSTILSTLQPAAPPSRLRLKRRLVADSPLPPTSKDPDSNARRELLGMRVEVEDEGAEMVELEEAPEEVVKAQESSPEAILEEETFLEGLLLDWVEKEEGEAKEGGGEGGN
ncbi:hypothetical protein JCM11251_006318 [Rhodosporidiobolus azoricus]